METPKEKVIDLLSKINNQEITPEIWDNASKGAKEDLKRKVRIVIDEALTALADIEYTEDRSKKYRFYVEALTELNKL